MNCRALWILLPCSLLANGAAAEPLTVDQCVEIALSRSASIDEAEAKVKQHEAVLAEVESSYYPKLAGIAFVAPMYTVRGDINSYERKWKSLNHWGPYTYLEALLAQPLYTFGRVEAGEKAASARAAVERARVREAELVVALEVRRLYFLRLFALSMLPALDNAASILDEAQEKGEEEYAKSSGEITQVDLMKLSYGASEISKFQIAARAGAALALSALKHTMGLAESEPLELADQRLPRLDDYDPPGLTAMLTEAKANRPEWIQITSGKEAAAALERAELLAMAPVLLLAGQIHWTWTPMRDDLENPYQYDPHNDLYGGVALALNFNLDPALAYAKADKARALHQEVEALEQFASTGIPLRVRKAYDEVIRFREVVTLSQDGVKSTTKWMEFAGAAYMLGTGEAKDLLEGLVAFLQAKQSYYENLQNYYIARAELDFAVGR
ncbi:MAG: hypothetical protein A2289_05330 [Deltaproteobacteria bacterium RIFOXYA12_FULL_58_15]|nr:MAG: hypothetical protein A2289_05330 [Deltaproteobacteria bacterium RIFOXYA12_FULL_58_15]OGR13089.1 MAG: hypothetical protein A2341_08405 [Deltaproteobacteria bacterium RIFOXYB12_FULL_58_9]